MNIGIYILCFNEAKILKYTVEHYLKMFPSCTIYICDNYSSDNSVEIAESLGCKIISWSSGGQNNTELKRQIQNNVWKKHNHDWIVCVDMDEWIYITEDQLKKEESNRVSVIQFKGYEVIGDSKDEDLKDVNLHKLNQGVESDYYNKACLFNRNYLKEITYYHGNHSIYPQGIVNTCSGKYILKHMNKLGLAYYLKKNKIRYDRSSIQRARGRSLHYTDKIEKIENEFNKLFKLRKEIKKPSNSKYINKNIILSSDSLIIINKEEAYRNLNELNL